MRKQKIAIIALSLWLSMVFVFMLLAQRVDLQIFFVLSFIGFLVIVELTELHYLRYIRYLIAAGIVIFGAIVAQNVMEVL